MTTLTTPPPEGRHRAPEAATAAIGAHDGLGEAVEAAAGRSRPRRTDIQGLRSVAVLLVVLYHAGVPLLGGGYVGVDVFFVISGFLITAHLVDEVDRTGRIRLGRFYARRIRRLLPAALVVITATVVVARLFGPTLESARTARDALFATVYAMNYHLASQGVDYQQAGGPPSPLQHFWSLAVEEQFYLLWPVAVLLVALATLRASARTRRAVLGVVVLAVSAVSLHQAVTLTATNGPLAYFSLQTRGWELGVGALLAVALPLLRRLPRVPAAAATWAGLVAVAASAVVYDDATPFPGTAALLPVVGAALVLAGGVVDPRGGVDVVLRNGPTQLVGNVSYGWYLWHWPALVLGPALFGTGFGLGERLAMAGLTLWLAVLTYLVVERSAARRALRTAAWLVRGAVLSALAALVAATVLVLAPQVQGDGADQAQASAADVAELQGQLRTALDQAQVPANLDPALDRADADTPVTSRNGCHVDFLSTEQPPCVFGDAGADRTVLLFGDSHAEQWFGPLDRWATQEGWRLVSWTKAACPLADVTIESQELGRGYTECDTWRSERLDAVAELEPDLIVASQADSLVPYDFSDSTWADATAETLRSLAGLTGSLVMLGDIPRPTEDVPSCLAAHLDDVSACDVASDAGLEPDGGDYSHLPGRHGAVRDAISTVDLTYVDTQAWACLGEVCPPVVGSTLVYRDDAHFTQTYATALEPLLGSAIEATLTGDTTTTGDAR